MVCGLPGVRTDQKINSDGRSASQYRLRTLRQEKGEM